MGTATRKKQIADVADALDPSKHRFDIKTQEPLGRPRAVKPREVGVRDVIPFTRDQEIALKRRAAKGGISVGRLIANVVDRWLAYIELEGEPRQLPLPTTDALNRLAYKARDARIELLDAVAKRNPATPKPPRPATPKRAM